MDKSIVPVDQIDVRSSTCYEFSNSKSPEVVEIEDDPVENVEKQMNDLEIGHQFNEKDVPQIFKTFINSRMSGLKEVFLGFNVSACLLKLDDSFITYEKINDDWTVTYKDINTTIETIDPEKSIIDHFWFVVKNPNIKLETFKILASKNYSKAENREKLDLEKLATLLQAMLKSINHQLYTNSFDWEGCNEDTFISMLKHVKPATLESIGFDISWKEEENYQKMKQIVEMDQWKQAKTIFSRGVTPLKIDDLFHCERFGMEVASVTPEDVLRVVEHVSNSSCIKDSILSCKHKKYDIESIIDFLRSQNDGSKITKTKPTDTEFEFVYENLKSDKRVLLIGDGNCIGINNY